MPPLIVTFLLNLIILIIFGFWLRGLWRRQWAMIEEMLVYWREEMNDSAFNKRWGAVLLLCMASCAVIPGVIFTALTLAYAFAVGACFFISFTVRDWGTAKTLLLAAGSCAVIFRLAQAIPWACSTVLRRFCALHDGWVARASPGNWVKYYGPAAACLAFDLLAVLAILLLLFNPGWYQSAMR